VVNKPSHKADKPQIHKHYTENTGVQFSWKYCMHALPLSR